MRPDAAEQHSSTSCTIHQHSPSCPLTHGFDQVQTLNAGDLELLTEHQQKLARAKLQTQLTRVSNAEAKARLEAFRSRLKQSAAARAAPAAAKAEPDASAAEDDEVRRTASGSVSGCYMHAIRTSIPGAWELRLPGIIGSLILSGCWWAGVSAPA